MIAGISKKVILTSLLFFNFLEPSKSADFEKTSSSGYKNFPKIVKLKLFKSQDNDANTNPVNEDSDEIRETASWVELLESGGLSQDMFLPIFGILVLLLFTKIGLSSRKIKKLKQELQELSESKSAWERLDLDEDGELSDLELEAYKLIRDKGKQPDANEEATQSAEISNDENAPFQASEFVDDSTNDWLMDELG